MPDDLAREKKFATPEEELAYLRSIVAEREQAAEKLGVPGGTERAEQAIEKVIETYRRRSPEELLAPEHRMTEESVQEVVLKLTPDATDRQVEELLGVLQTKGLRNTLTVLERMNNPHLMSDFHKVLVQYIHEGLTVQGLKKGTALWRALHMTLYEVALPVEDRGGRDTGQLRQLKELLTAMEQLYAGLFSGIGKSGYYKEYFTFEIAVSHKSEEAIFYVAVPNSKRDIFEKQILSIFPRGRVREQKDDFNIFNELGHVAGAYGKFSKHAAFPLKTFEQFEYDPLNIILAAFSKISQEGEGAAIQILVSPAGNFYDGWFKKILKAVNEGKKMKLATKLKPDAETIPGKIGEFLWKELKEAVGGKPSKHEGALPPANQMGGEQITTKLKSPIFAGNMRIITSARTEAKADAILSEIMATYGQFTEAQGNSIGFTKVEGRKLNQFIHDFIFRTFSMSNLMPFNLHELSTIFHLTIGGGTSSREVRQSKARLAPAPVNLPKEGIKLGYNDYSNTNTDIFFTPEDRMRHFYTIGQTGTGKTNFMKNMIIQDIKNGDGVCMIDPHGIDIVDVLSSIPRERWKDVIYFDPGYMPRAMALNMLEYDPRFPEQKTFVVNEMFSIFQKLYGAVPEALGPIFEQYFRNATMLVLEDPETGCTLLDVSRVMADPDFRDLKLSRCKNPVVVQFWEEIAERAGGEARLENIVPYVTSKFDIFLANEIMRPIVAQEKSSFNFREIMDTKKILLVNLSKGRLGDINSNLIGLILVGKILMAALSRADSIRNADLAPFYLYIDEFQNITTDSISTILSEARKYRLSLTVAHQFIKQLDDKIKNAVFGNVGSMAVFRVGPEDAEFLKTQFEPTFGASDMLHIENFNAYMKLLVHGSPTPPFNIKTLPFQPGDQNNVEMLREASYQAYGRPREEVEKEVHEKYKSMMSDRNG